MKQEINWELIELISGIKVPEYKRKVFEKLQKSGIKRFNISWLINHSVRLKG